jgi:signal transduction histidine kinase
MQAPSSRQIWGQRSGTALTLVALLIAGALLLIFAILALDCYQQAFIGFFPERDLTVSEHRSLADAVWPALEAGLVPGDRLIGIDNTDLDALPVEDRLEEFHRVLGRHDSGDRVTVTFLRDNAISDRTPMGAACQTVRDAVGLRECTMPITLGSLSTGDLFSYFGLGWIAGLVLWLVTTVIFLRRANLAQVRYTVLISALLVVFLAGRFDTLSTHRYSWVWLVTASLLAGMMVLFAMEFPYRFAAVQRMPVWRFAPVLAGAAFAGTSVALYRSTDSNLSQGAFVLAVALLILSCLILGGVMTWRRTRSSSPMVRNQSTMLLIGLLPMLVPMGVWLASLIVSGEELMGLVAFNQVLPILFPLSAMYAVSQFRLVDTDRVITQSTLYTLLLGFLVISYWLVVAGIALLIGRSLRETALNPVMIVLSIFLVAILFTPLRTFLQQMIDALYFRTRRAYRAYLDRFTREVTNAVNLSDVIGLIERAMSETLAPDFVILFVRDNVSYDYRPVPDPRTGQRLTDITFIAESGLVHYLMDRAGLLYLEEGRPLPIDVVGDRSRLAVLGAPVIVGLRGQRVLNGFLAVGPRQNGSPYLHEDLRFIESLGDQVALAVERAQAIDDLERRVRVQDVLSQVSRALNFAIDFDVLLELIYAQTTRVINAPNFYIALRDTNTDELSYVFYNEGDERVEHMEGRRWRVGRDLMSEVVRTQQTIRTDDFVRESLVRDPRMPLDNPNLKAWMGVPLLADTGGGVLGVMVAATTDPSVTFNDEQLDLFWDIANLASSAIDKLQLFEKTQSRARQLSVINQIASQLASEMGNVDRLLRLITENAVQILNTEAGSLLLVDEETSDLEFHVVVGGGGQELIGTRIPAGTGVAGATVQRAQSMIVNDPARDARWYGDMRLADENQDDWAGRDNGRDQTQNEGFQTRALLSVPLLVQNRVIGVLQMINKRDSSVFVQEDADLLETFAGQAAIAIENARLFDMTDQQLALRVQELDTMQRIDQELNRTLNLNNVVDITMDWALRKSGATAGALFILERERNELFTIASYGYPPGSTLYRASSDSLVYPADKGVVGRVIRTGQPSLITDVSIDPDYDETLENCVAQLTVPLFSANQVIGVIILESDHEGELDLLDLDFVARLAEHASPAIVNAQLFQELQRANQAKSEFVSFVAHDLKNPMTSMKGYADLLIKGVVGPVNEQQSDFLTTILNNVTRMETLVSDLNDLTKQETGNMRLEIFPVDFRNVVVETLRSQQRMIEEKSQELDLHVPENLPLVMGDQNRLIQIMTNFVSNANKYTPPGGTIRITANVSRNVWDPQGVQEVIHCQVEDTGIGMTEEDLNQLFIPYFRSDNPKTREQPGTGLGLTITKGLIEQHGGRVWVESEIETGTTFHFTIPVATEQAAERSRERV